MAGGGASGIAVGTVAVGGVLIWSGVRGVQITKTLQSLIKGEKPQGATPDYPVVTPQGVSSSSSSSPTGAASTGVTGAAGPVVALALAQVGVREGPGNSQKYSHELGRPSEAWCADFIDWLAAKTGNSHLVPQTASAPGMAQAFGSRFRMGTAGIEPGDIVFQHGAANGWNGIGHVGIAVSSTQMVAGNYGDRVAEYPWNTSKTVGYAKVGWGYSGASTGSFHG